MSSIERKGIVVGEGIPKTIVPVMPAGRDDALRAVQDAVDAGADCIELRLDFCVDCADPAAMSALCRDVARQLPRTLLLTTFRSKGQGGQADLPVDEYARLIGEIIESGDADLVDIEIGIGEDLVSRLCLKAWDSGVVPVVSHHDFEKTPCERELEGLLARMELLGAGVCKFAVMANSAADALRVMQVTEAFSKKSEALLLTMAMGPLGGITRLCGELFGSSMTFCSLEKASAPGQVQIAKARNIMQDLHDVAFG